MDSIQVQDLIISACQTSGLNVQLVMALADQESAFNPSVVRFEPGWRFLHYPAIFAGKLGITPATETVLQAISWGPLQVMGSVCRELGYVDHLTLLVNSSVAIELGCKKLVMLSIKHKNELDLISAYNCGTVRKDENGKFFNQRYVDCVTRRLSILRR